MNIALIKTVWMHNGGGEAPEALTVEGERIVWVQRVTYLGTVLGANGGPSSTICANAANHKD